MGRGRPARALQFAFPAPAQTAGYGGDPRHLVRDRDRGRQHAGSAHQAAGDRRASTGSPHLRSAARRRQLAAHLRAPHQGRRLRLGRHRHHPHQGARAEADRKRRPPARQRDRPEALAGRARRPRRKILAGKEPRRGSQPGEIQVPRQYEPRTAHAAERHHRLLRDHGQRHVRRARLRQVSGVLPRHPDIREIPARSHQRHPRHVEDRSRPHEARHGAARPVEDTGGVAARGVRTRRGQAIDAGRRYRKHHFRDGRPPRGQADLRQPVVQCRQVHPRRRQDHRAEPRAARTRSC